MFENSFERTLTYKYIILCPFYNMSVYHAQFICIPCILILAKIQYNTKKYKCKLEKS